MAVSHLTGEGFAEAIATGDVLVDFWADWCGPCKMLAPVIDELAAEYAGRVSVAKVDTDANGELAMSLGITGIPTVILFRDGTEVHRFVGVRPKSDFTAVLGQ